MNTPEPITTRPDLAGAELIVSEVEVLIHYNAARNAAVKAGMTLEEFDALAGAEILQL